MEEDEKKVLVLFEAAGHKAELDANGEPDPWAFNDDEDFHNGFSCMDCWDVVCVHCVGDTGFGIGPCSRSRVKAGA